MQGLKDRHLITHSGEIARAGQSRRAGADDRHLFTKLFLCALRNDTIFPGPVRRKAFQLSDGDRLTLDASDTFPLALALLRTYTPTDRRKGRRFADHLICRLDIAALYFFNKPRDIDSHRASFDTLGILTADTSGSLFHRFLHVITQTYLFKVCCSHFRILLPDRHLF